MKNIDKRDIPVAQEFKKRFPETWESFSEEQKKHVVYAMNGWASLLDPPIEEHTHIPILNGKAHVTWHGDNPPSEKQMEAFEEMARVAYENAGAIKEQPDLSGDELPREENKRKVEGFPKQEIKSVYVVTQQGASGYRVGFDGVTAIKMQPLLMGDPHFVIFADVEVHAIVNCQAPCDVQFITTPEGE